MKKLKPETGKRPEPAMPSLISLSKWTRDMGINPVTVWRWRKMGWLKTCNIAGRVYVTSEAIREFQDRVESGEFAKEHKVPINKHEKAKGQHKSKGEAFAV